MNEYRYILQTGSRKYNCPECGKKTFVSYLDTTTGDILPEQYGRCDREINCAYHLNPYKDGYSKTIWKQEQGLYSGDWKPTKLHQDPGQYQYRTFLYSQLTYSNKAGQHTIRIIS